MTKEKPEKVKIKIMNRQQTADYLAGKTYPDNNFLNFEDNQTLIDSNMVAVFGNEYKTAQVRGKISGQIVPGPTLLNKGGFKIKHECNCSHCAYPKTEQTWAKIKGFWVEGEESYWLFKTDLAKVEFEVTLSKDGVTRKIPAIVFSFGDLPAVV
jgi:hypothetical protein